MSIVERFFPGIHAPTPLFEPTQLGCNFEHVGFDVLNLLIDALHCSRPVPSRLRMSGVGRKDERNRIRDERLNGQTPSASDSERSLHGDYPFRDISRRF
jgi:hypothetical protein